MFLPIINTLLSNCCGIFCKNNKTLCDVLLVLLSLILVVNIFIDIRSPSFYPLFPLIVL